MTDDKAVEAALVSWDDMLARVADADSHLWRDNMKDAMRAALAAADKVRAEGFDELWQELVEKDDRTSPAEYPDMALITREELRRAFAAGLAKGGAERAAVEKVRDEWCDAYTRARDDRAAMVDVLEIIKSGEDAESAAIAANALALVRKGV